VIAISQLVVRLGQRFESARRLSEIHLDKPNTRNVRWSWRCLGDSLHHPYITKGGDLGTMEPSE
jgi:hypothetical protein